MLHYVQRDHKDYLGRKAQSFHLHLYTAPELCHTCRSIQHCFTFTETIRTIRDGDPRMSTSTFEQLPSSERSERSSSVLLYLDRNGKDF